MKTLTAAIERVAPRRIVLTLLCIALLLGVASTIAVATGVGQRTFSLDGESSFGWPLWTTRINVPAFCSSVILVMAAVAWVNLAFVVRRDMRCRVAAAVLAFGLGFMAIDESFSLHESAERSLHVDWQVLLRARRGWPRRRGRHADPPTSPDQPASCHRSDDRRRVLVAGPSA